MKKIILLITIFSATSVLAQGPFTKGNFYAGVMLGFNSQKDVFTSKNGNVSVKNDPIKTRNFIFNPEVSYFIMDNLALGLNVGIESNKSESTSMNGPSKVESIYKSSGPMFGLYARKYWSCSEKFATFMSVGLGMSNVKGKDETTTSLNNVSTTKTEEDKQLSRNLYLNAGFSYNISPRILLLGTFAILSFYSDIYTDGITNDSERENKVTGVNFDINNRNIPFNLGFVYRLKP